MAKAKTSADATTGNQSVPLQSTYALQSKFAMARAAMMKAMIERETEIDMVLTAMLIKEHVLLVGPPGCGKSQLLNGLLTFCGGKLFTYLMTKFSTPEELYGPPSLTALKNDKFYRITTGRLPEAEFGYIDEVFKGSPAILNTLLTIMNEGTFDDGRGVVPVPLRLLVGSSNEYPRDDDGLNAMLDRFLLRKKVKYIVGHAQRKQLLWGGSHIASFSSVITTTELDQAIAEVKQVPFSDDAKHTMDDIVEKLRSAGISPSDRRLVKSLKIAQATAWLGYPTRLIGDPSATLEVTPDDFELLSHALWVDPETHPQQVSSIVAAVSNPMMFTINSFLMEAEQIIQNIDTKDPGKLAKSTGELKKLAEILKKLESMKPHPRVKQAIDHVASSLKEIKTAMIG